MPDKTGDNLVRIALVGEFSPPHAGMAVQAELLVNRLPALGVQVRRIVTNFHFTGPFSFLNRARFLRGLIRLLAFCVQCRTIIGVDVVHIFSSSGLNFYLFTGIPVFICNLFNKRYIVNYHGGNAEAFFRKRRRLLDWSLRRNSSLVVPSGFLQDIFSRYGHASIVIPNVINTDRFTYRDRDQFPPNVMVCRNFTETYNVACAIRAFGRVQKIHPEATLRLAGDGPQRTYLEGLIQSLALGNVTFLGNIANDRMNEIYLESDIFLNTSNVDNMPNSILEAFACGLPVVSTNPGGIPYMVDHGVSGLLADVDNDEELATYILQIIDDPEFAKRLVKAGKNSLAAYTWDAVGPAWLSHYRDLLS
ncbi:MAG: glycosyltransferase family 4 protein [Acidiferrobacterales bacterium]